MKSRALVVVSLLGAGACSFAPSNGAVGGDGHQPPDSSDDSGRRDAGRDVGAEGSTPVDALPILPDAPSGSCMAQWRSGTPPTFKLPGSLQISSADSTQRDPTLSPDERTLYFASNATSSQTRYWFVTLSAAGTVSSTPIQSDALGPSAIGSDAEGKLTMNAAFLDVTFASDRGGASSGGLWHSHRTAVQNNFSAPDQVNLGAVNVAGTHLADPQLAGDDLHLYYASDDGNRTQHIYMATRPDVASAWRVGVPFASLDSMAGDADPSLSQDESTILFSSQRSGGLGGTDIYYATRASAGGEFGPVHPVPGGNTTKNEGDPVLSRDGCSIVFATDAGEAAAFDYDIWAIDMMNP